MLLWLLSILFFRLSRMGQTKCSISKFQTHTFEILAVFLDLDISCIAFFKCIFFNICLTMLGCSFFVGWLIYWSIWWMGVSVLMWLWAFCSVSILLSLHYVFYSRERYSFVCSFEYHIRFFCIKAAFCFFFIFRHR